MILDETKMKGQLGGLQKDLSWAVVKPYMAKAERWFRNQVGKDLYLYLETLTPTTEQLEEKELQELAEGAIAFYGFSLVQPRINLKVGDAGMMKMLPSNHVAITKWEFVSMAESNQTMIDICIDGFWQQLEEMETPPEDWTGSEGYKLRNELFIKDATELTNHLPLANNSVRMFEAIKHYIRKAERDSIEVLITAEVYDGLKIKLKMEVGATALTATDKTLLELIEDALALTAIQSALPYISVLVDTEGVRLVVKTDSTRNEIEADYDSKSALLAKLGNDIEKANSKITTYLKKVSSEILYPSFFEIHAESDPFDIFSMEDSQHPIL